MLDTSERDNGPLWSEESVAVCLHSPAVDFTEPLCRTQQWVTKSVVLVRSHVHQLRENQFRLAPDFTNLIVRGLQLSVHLLICDLRVPYRLSQNSHRIRHSRVESRRLVHQALSRRCALNVSAQLVYRLQHLICAPPGCRFERQPVDDMRNSS